MPQVTIDVNSVVPYFLNGWVSGIGRTTMELVTAMAAIEDPSVDLTLYSQNMKGIGAKNLLDSSSIRRKHLYLPHRDQWNKLLAYTPIRKWLTGYDLYHLPHNFDYVHHPDRTIVTIHDALFFASPDESFDHQFAREHYPRLAKQCRAIITCSESSKRDIMQYMDITEEKIFVTPWGINKERFYPNKQKKTGSPFFLMVSCKGKRKNAMNLIRAYELFVKHHPEHELIMVWPNTPQEIIDYCSKEPLRSHIYFETDVDDDRLNRLYNEATATFFPSRYEGFGLPILESMACGTPVVTCRNSSLEEVGGSAALYVDPDDIDGMAHYMEQFEEGHYDLEALSQACLAQASLFSWQRCAEATLNVYKQCML